MKRFTIILFLSLLIINPSQAQRGWRSFDQFGFVHQIYQSADDSYWDGRSENEEQVSPGTYFYQIEAGDYTETRKMVILK